MLIVTPPTTYGPARRLWHQADERLQNLGFVVDHIAGVIDGQTAFRSTIGLWKKPKYKPALAGAPGAG